MSKRPQIKQSDGSLLDLPLDAETLQGKGLSDLASKADLDKKIDKNSGTATNLSLEGTTYIGNNAINGGGLGSIRFGTGTGFHFEDLPVNKLSFRNSESNTSYDLTVPTKSGTIALLEDLEGIGGGGSGASIELVATGTIVKSESSSIEIYNVSLKEKTQYILRLWDGMSEWWDTLRFVYTDGNENQYVTITNSDEDAQSAQLYFDANTSIILGGSSSDTFIYDNGSNYELYEVQGGGSGSVSEEDVLQIIEDNSSNTSQMDVDTSITIGTSADYNPNSDNQIPTTKAVQEMINVGGGSGGSGDYLPLSGGTMTGKINISPGGGIWAGSGGFSTIIDYPAIFTDDLSIYVTSNLEETGEDDGYWFNFPEESGTFAVKTGNNKLLNINSIEDDNEKHNRLYLAYDSDQIGISSLYNEFFFTNSKGVSEDMKHYLAYPDPSSNGVNEEYTWTLPSKSGTVALTEDIVTESRVNELIAAYMTANYDNGDEGSY